MNIFSPDYKNKAIENGKSISETKSKTKSKNKYLKETLLIKTLSPLNIGNGEKYTNLDYYIEDKKAKIIDIERMMENLKDIDKINQMQNLIKNNMGNNKMTMTVMELYHSVGLYPENHVSKEIDCKIKENASVQVAKFINQNGKYYVPGSSIKGAIRTAYIFDYYDKNFDKLISILDDREIRNKGTELVKRAIGNIQNDFFKHLLITDSKFIDFKNFEFIETKRYNIEHKKRGNSNLYGNSEHKEVLKKGSEFTVEMTIKKDFPKDFEDIKTMCNNFTKTIIDFEMKNQYLPQELKEFYKKNILSDINKNNNNNNNDSFYLALGSGSGYLSKTIYLLLWKHKKNLNLIKKLLPTKNDYRTRKFQRVNSYLDFPRTRTVEIIKNIPLGWVKITTKKI